MELQLVGMNAVIMDNVQLGDESIVGALTFIKEGEIIPIRSVVVGNPGKIIKQVSDQMLSWKIDGTKLYQQLPKECHNSLKMCKPLRKKRLQQKLQQKTYLNLKS